MAQCETGTITKYAGILEIISGETISNTSPGVHRRSGMIFAGTKAAGVRGAGEPRSFRRRSMRLAARSGQGPSSKCRRSSGLWRVLLEGGDEA